MLRLALSIRDHGDQPYQPYMLDQHWTVGIAPATPFELVAINVGERRKAKLVFDDGSEWVVKDNRMERLHVTPVSTGYSLVIPEHGSSASILLGFSGTISLELVDTFELARTSIQRVTLQYVPLAELLRHLQAEDLNPTIVSQRCVELTLHID